MLNPLNHLSARSTIHQPSQPSINSLDHLSNLLTIYHPSFTNDQPTESSHLSLHHSTQPTLSGKKPIVSAQLFYQLNPPNSASLDSTCIARINPASLDSTLHRSTQSSAKRPRCSLFHSTLRLSTQPSISPLRSTSTNSTHCFSPAFAITSTPTLNNGYISAFAFCYPSPLLCRQCKTIEQGSSI